MRRGREWRRRRGGAGAAARLTLVGEGRGEVRGGPEGWEMVFDRVFRVRNARMRLEQQAARPRRAADRLVPSNARARNGVRHDSLRPQCAAVRAASRAVALRRSSGTARAVGTAGTFGRTAEPPARALTHARARLLSCTAHSHCRQ